MHTTNNTILDGEALMFRDAGSFAMELTPHVNSAVLQIAALSMGELEGAAIVLTFDHGGPPTKLDVQRATFSAGAFVAHRFGSLGHRGRARGV